MCGVDGRRGDDSALASVLLMGAMCLGAGVVASMAASSRSDDCFRCMRVYLWITAALWGMGAIACFLSAVGKRRRVLATSTQEDGAVRPWGRYVVLALGMLTWGVYGLTLVQDQDCEHETPNRALWAQRAVIAMAILGVVGSLVGILCCLLASIRGLVPDQETAPALVLLRCSCCAPSLRCTFVLLPLLGLSLGNALLWYHTRECDHAANKLLCGGAIIVFLTTATIVVALVTRETWKSLSKPTTSQRKRCRVFLLCCLAICGIGAITWGIRCVVWLAQNQVDGMGFKNLSGRLCGKKTRAILELVVGEMFALGAVILIPTCCCRLERHLLSTSNTEVDLSMLSPHALRQPAATKREGQRGDNRIV